MLSPREAMNLPSEAHIARELLSIKEACERAKVSKKTIYNWLKHGKLDAVRTASGHIRIFADSLFRPLGIVR